MKVYYNSACPVCNAGIKRQKIKLKDHPVEWHDIHLDIERRNDLDVDLEFTRERLHIVGDDGEVQVGIDALIALAEKSPTTNVLSKVLSIPGIHVIGKFTYNVFARCLYKTNRLMKNW